MKAIEQKRAVPCKHGARMASPRRSRWFVIGMLLLLPVGIGIGLRLSRSSNSDLRQPSKKETPVTSTREIRAEESATDDRSRIQKTESDPAVNSILSGEQSRSKSQELSLEAAGGNVRFSAKTFLAAHDLITISKITPTPAPSPVYELIAGPKKSFHPRNWLEIEVEFSTQRRVANGAVFQFQVQIDGTLFTGEIAVAPLERANGLLTVGYLSPSSYRRAFLGREPKSDAGMRIEITAISEGEEVCSARYENAKGLRPIKQQFEQTIRAKSDTPFAPLYWDRYVEAATASPSDLAANAR